MIFDSLDNCETYKSLSSNFRTAFEYLQQTNFSIMPNGKYDIDGKNVYASISEPILKEWDEKDWEAHRKYADIQVILDGEEIIGYSPAAVLTEKSSFDTIKDCGLYTGEGIKLTVKAKQFLVFFPQDAHKPGVMAEKQKCRKAVVKVLLK